MRCLRSAGLSGIEAVGDAMGDMGKSDILAVGKDDKAYPQMLKDIPKAPERLFFRGNVAAVNDMPCLAVIGSRKASARGLEMAFSFGRMAAEAGFGLPENECGTGRRGFREKRMHGQ